MAVNPGYACLIRRSGSSTTVTSEACSLTSGTTYRITSAARRCIDPEAVWHFKDGVTTIAFSAISSVDLVNGEVTLASAPGGAVTFNGNFLPLTTTSEIFAEAKNFSLSQSADLYDTTVFTGTANLNTSLRRRIVGLRDAEVSVDSVASGLDLALLETYKNAGSTVVVEVYLGSVTEPRFRGFCKVESVETSGDVGDLIQTTVAFKIAAVTDALGFSSAYAYKVQP